ncbi:MAG: PA14 domain-containing protein, partial [Bacteroidota bacterium]
DGGTLVASADLILSISSQIGSQNGGIRYIASDVAHWQPRPYQQVVTAKTGYPVTLDDSYIIWRLNESSGQAETDANYFFHGIMSGIIIPQVDGPYTFEVDGDAEGNPTLWLAEGLGYANFPNEPNPIDPVNFTAYDDSAGTVILEAGKPYYFEAHHRQIINDWELDLQWQTPGDPTLRPLTDNDVALYVDTELPSAPLNLTATLGETVALVDWEESVDNDAIAGYHVFVNGARANEILLLSGPFLVDSLMGNTPYEFTVVAVDVFGNHSFPADLLRLTTPVADLNPPATANNLVADLITAFKAEVSWDAVPGALGYDLYVDGTKVNEAFITADSFVIRDLLPETTYALELRTLNVSLVASVNPATLSITTLPFDALNTQEDVYLIDTEMILDPVARSTGIGINFGPGLDVMLRNDPLAFDSLTQQFQPGGFRFGAITANSISFTEATGTSPDWATYGEYAQASLDAGGKFVALTVGPGPNEDYFLNPNQAFTRLMEYLGGDGSTAGGARRVAEGFTDPFIPQFDKILIELGNEVWGGNAHNSPIGISYATTYLPWCQQVTDIISSSPYYDPDRIMVVISARSPRFPGFHPPIFNSTALDDDFPYLLALSGYVGGNIMDDGEDFGSLTNNRLAYHKESYKVMRNYLRGIGDINNFARNLTDRTWAFYPYESNCTQNTYHGSLGQALLMIDYLHEFTLRGAFFPSLFHLEGGQWRMVTREADGSYTKRPLFEVGALSNVLTRGGIQLRTARTTFRQLTDPAGASFDLAPVGVHAFNRGNAYTLMYFSRDFEHDYIARVDLPDILGTISNARMITLSGANFDAESVEVSEMPVSISDGMLIDVAKYSLVLLSFEAGDFALEAPLFWSDSLNATALEPLEQASEAIKVFPSPVHGMDASLWVREFDGERVEVGLWDATGRRIWRNEQKVDQMETIFSLPTQHLPAGIYVVTVKGKDRQEAVRMVVK